MAFDQDSLARLFGITTNSRTFRPQLEALHSVVEVTGATRYLEIGAFEGRSAALFCGLVAASRPSQKIHLTSIDSWVGGDEHQSLSMSMMTVEDTYDEVVRECKEWLPHDSCFEKIKSLSVEGLRSISDRKGYYDLVLVDAGHKAKDVLSDLIHVWPLLRRDGVLILDDYTWIPRHVGESFLPNSPKLGIDAFCTCFYDELTIISNLPLLQLYLLKTSPSTYSSHYMALASSPLPLLFEQLDI
jgi:predicted O-methyltransferase YrrM